MKVAFSCVVDDNPKYARQALLWAASLLIHGDQSAESLVVHTVGEGEPRLSALLSSWGVDVVHVEAFDLRHPPSNKLAQFATASLQNADYAVLCDCDLAFAGSISPWLSGKRIRARIAQRPWLPPAQWNAIFAAAGLRFPTARVLAGNGEPTPPTFCNGGLYIVPRTLFARIGTVWCKWDRWLLERLDLLKPRQIFADQVSFCLACEELGLTIDYLPFELNYPMAFKQTALPKSDGWKLREPRVLHYHDLTDARGFLHKGNVASVNAAVERINELILCLRELYSFDKQGQFMN